MRKVQIIENIENQSNAGSKAPSDIEKIAARLGYKGIVINRFEGSDKKKIKWYTSRIKSIAQFLNFANKLQTEDIVLLQFPFRNNYSLQYKILRYVKRKKRLKYIGIIHDIEKIRNIYDSKHYDEDYKFMLECADVLIVHNEVMKSYLVNEGFSDEHIVCLGVFDYLTNLNHNKVEYDKSITIAGNLNPEKSGYIYKLDNIPYDVHLYGVNYDESVAGSNMKYHGSYNSEDIVRHINKGFGLIWDGNSVETCSGNTGNYLKYNNPHKLSLYLAAGLPVIIWNQAAEAEFVKKHDIGFCVSSLEDIGDILADMTEEEYGRLRKNVFGIQANVLKGKFAENALGEAEKIINSL